MNTPLIMNIICLIYSIHSISINVGSTGIVEICVFLHMLIFFFFSQHTSLLIILQAALLCLRAKEINLWISHHVFPMLYSICSILQVNFCYFEAGENKQALVKLVTCERWVSVCQCWFCVYAVVFLPYRMLVPVLLRVLCDFLLIEGCAKINFVFHFFSWLFFNRCASKLNYKRQKEKEQLEKRQQDQDRRKR